ncbi:MAG: hypothetical protein N3G22_03270 [Candidatus Micrarchaeota archaeon]|nr:hypothetical protein [Candidatus Micrarchaeota archaeon]
MAGESEASEEDEKIARLFMKIEEQREAVFREVVRFKNLQLSDEELIKKLKKGSEIERLAAARLLGFKKCSAAVEALSTMLWLNRQNLPFALELVGALERIGTPGAAISLFYRVFDDTDELAKCACSAAIGRMGIEALTAVYAHSYSQQFYNYVLQNGKSLDQIRKELLAIEEFARRVRLSEAQKRMESQVRQVQRNQQFLRGNPPRFDRPAQRAVH